MGKKNLVVIGISLVILIIAAGLAYVNYKYVEMTKEEISTLNAIIQQKDTEIMKLIKVIKLKQVELSGVRAELNNANKALNDAKIPVIRVIPQEAIPASKTVNK